MFLCYGNGDGHDGSEIGFDKQFWAISWTSLSKRIFLLFCLPYHRLHFFCLKISRCNTLYVVVGTHIIYPIEVGDWVIISISCFFLFFFQEEILFSIRDFFIDRDSALSLFFLFLSRALRKREKGGKWKGNLHRVLRLITESNENRAQCALKFARIFSSSSSSSPSLAVDALNKHFSFLN